MADEWTARPDRPIEVPFLRLQLSEQLERLREEPTWRASGRNGSAVSHDVEALEESACLLTLARAS